MTKPTFTRTELETLLSTIEADIRHAEAEEKLMAKHGLYANALEWKARQVGLFDARVRLLALLQT